ncbi:copper resistance protein CopC [Micromonospora sp. DR5-3]|uniref:copper resistance CopC family protein n=1 Tax=unclassified Micromonospora TaxID=2617518 RepID=UPI0011D6BFE0|nr:MULTISPECIES: copper resistance CopC family protein [unclassified Micromonospora]MCW3815114.1 copper resistance protein CopC [Micromonospora sp. DR5-3]TYC21994.1 copper resistance protein CopC [Micromonospora sp. MP36]
MCRLGHLLTALTVAGLTVLVGPTPAQAHAYLARSAPADGAVLDRAPDTLTLAFTEHVELSAARISLVDGDGRPWAVTGLALRGEDGAPATDADSEEPVTLVAGLPALPPNTYHVSWRTLSSDDLHTTGGTLVFGIGRQVTAVGVTRPAAPGPRETAARAVGLLGLAILLGGAALALLTAAGTRRRGRTGGDVDLALPRRLLVVAGCAGVVALLAAPLQLTIQLSGAGGGRWPLLVDQLTSGRWLLREVGTAALLAAVLGATRRLRAGRAVPGAVAVGLAGALAAAAGTALLGHPMGGPLRTALVGGVHVLAAGGWAGAVLAAVLALLPAARRAPDRAAQVRAVLRAFAPLAVGCLTLLLLTGLLLTGPQVATADALLGSPYGLLLLAKVAAVGGAGLLGARTARRLRRADLPWRGLRAEAGLLAVVLALAGALAAAGPGRGPAFPVADAPRSVPQVTGQAADLVDTVAVRPNRPGRNVVSISVGDTRRPAPAQVTGVSLLLTGPNGERAVHPVTRTADGWVVTVDDIRSPGQWRVGVTVLREGLPPVSDTHPWLVPAGDAAAPVRVSAAPLRPALDRAALLVALVALAGAAFAGRRWWRGRRSGTDPDGPVPADRLAVTGGVPSGL